MVGSWPQQDHPYLTAASCKVTSKADTRYNCIAWAAKDDLKFWWPDQMGIGYWPAGITREVTIGAFVGAY